MMVLSIQALALDDGQIYKERLEVMLHRLELRSELYKQPERPEDIAGMIIEQVKAVAFEVVNIFDGECNGYIVQFNVTLKCFTICFQYTITWLSWLPK